MRINCGATKGINWRVRNVPVYRLQLWILDESLRIGGGVCKERIGRVYCRMMRGLLNCESGEELRWNQADGSLIYTKYTGRIC